MNKKPSYDPHARYITLKLLERLDACEYWKREYMKEFPFAAKVSYDNLLRAFQLGLPVNWLIRSVCTEHGRSRFDACENACYRLHSDQRISRDRMEELLARKAYEVLTTEWK